MMHVQGMTKHIWVMPKWNFLVVLDSAEYQFLGIIMIMHVYHVLIIGYVFYTLCLVSACSCIGHASHMHTRCNLCYIQFNI